MADTQPDRSNDAVIAKLDSQYSVYRDEVRLYVQLMFGSASLFGLLLYWEISAVSVPILWAVLPLTVVSFCGLLALMMVFLGVIAAYTELLELKLNYLLGDRADVFMFESYYIGLFSSSQSQSNRSERGFPYLIVIWILASIMPLLLCGYALWKLMKSYPVGGPILAIFVLAALPSILVCAVKIVANRRRENKHLLDAWKKQVTVPVDRDASDVSMIGK